MSTFRYDDAIIERFPTTTCAALVARGVTNGPTPVALRDELVDAQAETRARLGDTPLSEVPSLAAWRRVFTAFGVSPTKYRSAAEAIARRITKKGDLPSISTLVDLGNLVSVRHSVPVAVIDLGAVDGGITVRFARGDEPFDDLGGSEAEHPDEGEVVFVDESDAVTARRWCWRQSRATAAGPATTDVLIVAEAHHDTAAADLAAALADLERLLAAHAAPAELSTALLDRERTSFSP
ncbi:MAG: phenylalanine--tRNA ligase beta subunit-related protein [Actinomycetota bacterium]